MFLRRVLWLAVALWLTTTASLSAGAWTQPEGHYYTKSTFIYSTSENVFGSSLDVPFTSYSLYFYAEYGLRDDLTLILNIPAYQRFIDQQFNYDQITYGVFAGDFRLSARYNLLARPLVVSMAAGAKLPGAYNVEDRPPLGNGETDFEANLLVGKSLYPIPAYITLDGGYHLRGGEFTNEYTYSVEAGYTLRERYLFRFMIDGVRYAEEKAEANNLFGFPLMEEKTRVGGGIIYKINTTFDIDLSYLKTVSGKNIPESQEIFVGIAYHND